MLEGVPPKELRAYGPPDDIEYVLVEINPKKQKLASCKYIPSTFSKWKILFEEMGTSKWYLV